jgi:branched-chain amino acid transport system substrate-binding protein
MFELMIQDVGTDSQTAIALSEKFLEAGAITISTIPFSDTMIPVAQLAAEYGATVIQAQSTQVEMHMGIVDNFITNVSPDPFTATAGAKFALSQGVKNVVLFTSDEGGSWSARTPVWFGDVIEAGGGKVQASLNFSFGTSDWSPQIAELKKLDPVPDAIYISSVMPDVGVLIRQMRTSGLDAWVIGSDGLDDPSLDAIGEADATILDKVAFATLAPSHRDSAMASFQAECEALDIPVSGLFPALGSDIVMAIAYGVEKSGSTDPVAVREAIRAADSITVKTVESVSFKEHGSYAQRTIPVIGFKDGKRILVSNEIPDGVPSDWN